MASASAAVMVFLGWWTIQNVGNNFLDSTLFSTAAIFCCLASFSLGEAGIQRRSLVFCLILVAWILATNALLQKVGNNFLDSSLFSWAVIFCCLASLSVGQLQFHRRTFVLCLVVAAWMLVADVVSTEPLPAIARDVSWFVLPLLVYFFGKLALAHRDFLKAVRIAVALSLIWICLDLFLSADDVYNWIYAPVFGNVRRLGMSVGIMAVFLYLDGDMAGAERKLIVFARVIGLAMLFWSGSRASFLGWGVAFVICFGVTKARRGTIGPYLVEIVAALMLAAIFNTGVEGMGLWNGLVRPSSMQNTTLDQMSSSRLTLWHRTASVFNDPYCAVFGAGGNGFVRLKLMVTNQMLQPHNVVLQVATDWGWPGLLLFVSLGAFVLKRVLSLPNITEEKKLVGLGMLAFLMIAGLLDAGFYHLEYLIYLALALSMLLSGQGETATGGPVVAVPKAVVFLFLLGAVGVHIHLKEYRPEWVNTPWMKTVQTYGVCAGGVR